jgi:alkanesulfonate monooxygenase SsuD/methylene tetrahydromethanopterin reductase-like flavin-dependent oxidoreductase (luciferase family)
MTRFGLLLPQFGFHADRDLLVEGAQLADRVGFGSIWVRDHLVFRPQGLQGTDRTFIEPFLTLTYLAARTERIGLGASPIIPPRNWAATR